MLVYGLEHGPLREACLELFPCLGLAPLMGQLLDNALVCGLLLEPLCELLMCLTAKGKGLAALAVILECVVAGHIAIRDCDPQIVVREGYASSAFEQGILKRKTDWSPRGRHEFGVGKDFLLGQTGAARPYCGHDGFNAPPTAILLNPLQHSLEEVIDCDALQVVVKTSRQLLMASKQAKLFCQGAQEERIDGHRVCKGSGLQISGQRLVVLGQIGAQQVARRGGVQRLDHNLLPLALDLQRLKHRAGQARCHDMHALWQKLRPPAQIAKITETIQAIQRDDPAIVLFVGMG